MTTKTFKQMIREGEVKRADAMKVRLDDIHEEPGFNLRIEGEDLEQSINLLAGYILDGGVVPPLEVRPRDEGGVWLVDGHRRRRAYLKARAAGAPIEWIFVVPFTGNDADRVTRIITANSITGPKLKPREVQQLTRAATGFYQRLSAQDGAAISQLLAGEPPALEATITVNASAIYEMACCVNWLGLTGQEASPT